MRILLYVLSLLAGAYVLQGVLMALMVGTIVNLQSSPHPLMGAFFVLPYLLPLMLLVGRGYLWFKRKRIAVPASFGWFSYAVSCIAAGAVVLTSAGYAVLMLMGEGGLSGIPLGLVLMLCGLALSLTMPVVELRDWRAYRRGIAPAGRSALAGPQG